MEIKINKFSNKLGDDYLHEESVMADIQINEYMKVIIEVDNCLYSFPLSVITAEKIECEQRYSKNV